MKRDEEEAVLTKLLSLENDSSCSSLEEAEMAYLASVLFDRELPSLSENWHRAATHFFQQQKKENQQTSPSMESEEGVGFPDLSSIVRKHQVSLSRFKDMLLFKQQHPDFTLMFPDCKR